MRRVLLLLAFGSLLVFVDACGGDDGGGVRHSRKDTAGGDDVGGGDTSGSLCSNGAQDPGESDLDCGGPCDPCGLSKVCFVGTDCASGYCGSGYLCRAAGCGNGTQDPGELGVDCGGPCPACLGASCGDDAGCATGYCKGGACDVPTCADGVRNGRETGVDCGGDCSQCADGQGCLTDLNCLSGTCRAGFCTTASCSDGARNQDESDVDCGGPCGGCANGKACHDGGDCASGACQGEACVDVPPACDDGAKNGAESDVDCGGGCPGCPFGKVCKLPSDCASGLCTQGSCAAPATCDDGQKNGGESDTDCGGPCKACATGKYCDDHPDCLSATCVFGVCKEPTCVDGVKNQGEADIDCAGPCGLCADGKACAQGATCASNYCSVGVCVSCTDGKKNGTEVDVDCGGGCPKCGLGKDCTKAGDCQSNACEGGECCTPNSCGECTSTPNEVCDGKDNDCDGQTDEKNAIGAPPSCAKQQGVCKGSVSACKGTQGWVCDEAVYKAFNAAYQAAETTCDSKDNDCDGQTDEGLKNACGTCGATPTEMCNGADDDCDGQTDELTQCASCADADAGLDLASADSSYGGFGGMSNRWLEVLGDDAWFLFTASGYYSTTLLIRASDGMVQDTYSPSIAPIGSTALIAADGKLHIALAGTWYSGGIGTHKALYYQYSTAGAELTEEVVADVTNLGGQGCGLDWAQGGPWLAYVTYDDGTWAAKRTGANSWVPTDTLPVSDEYNFQFVVDGQGQFHTAERVGYWDDADIVAYGPGGSQTLCDTGCSSTTCATPCYRPILRRAPDGTLHVVYDRAGSIQYRKRGSSSFGAAEPVDTGDSPGLGFTPDGRPVISYVKADTELWVATRKGSSWVTEQVSVIGDPDATYEWATGVVVDQSGRYHLGVVVRHTDGYYDTSQSLRYVMFCSHAGGGQVEPPLSSCGADPSKTCSGGCGGQGVGCWCDAACVDYGNCCPDYQACCN